MGWKFREERIPPLGNRSRNIRPPSLTISAVPYDKLHFLKQQITENILYSSEAAIHILFCLTVPPSAIYKSSFDNSAITANLKMWLYIQIILALLVILLVRWISQRKKCFQVLQNLGYKVPPVEFIGGNLLNLFMG